MQTILIVDQDDDDQEIIRSICKSFRPDHHVVSLYNGYEALEYLTATSVPPLLIFCEMTMPNLSGLELLQILQSRQDLSNVANPIVFMSTRSSSDNIQKAYSLGVKGFFEKPPSYAQFKEIVEVAILFWEKSINPVLSNRG